MVIEINLLPWRDKIREKQKKVFYYWISFCLFIICIIFYLLHYFLQHEINAKQFNTVIWQKKIANISVARQAVVKMRQQIDIFQFAMQFMGRIDAQQMRLLDFFNHVLSETPSEIVFTEIINQENKMLLLGMTHSVTALTTFVKTFHQAELTEINNQSQHKQFHFQIQVLQNDNTNTLA